MVPWVTVNTRGVRDKQRGKRDKKRLEPVRSGFVKLSV